tara:strand:- start:154 stop:1281 length:1128 start_codon:yes stop_codon:yes gene_type:complete
MSSLNLNFEPELLSNEDANHFQSVINALINDSANILIISDDKKTTAYIYNLLKQRLIHKNGKKSFLYQQEKLESFLADSLLGPFENAFSKITETSNIDQKPAKKILFITDSGKLDDREVNLLLSLNSKKVENPNSIVVFFHDLIKTSHNKNKLLSLFDESIQWEPDPISKSHNPSINETEEDFSKSNKKKFNALSKNILLISILIGILISVMSLSKNNFLGIREYSNQVLNYFKTFKVPYLNIPVNSFFKEESLLKIHSNSPKSEDALNIEVLNLSELSQLVISNGYIIQYSAHLKKVSALQWISNQHNLSDLKLIKLEKNSDNSNFYAVVSKPFENYKQAVDSASSKKFAGKAWVRSLKSIKRSQEKNQIENYF